MPSSNCSSESSNRLSVVQSVTLFTVGKILRSVGLKGWVKITPITHSLDRFKNLTNVYVGINERDAEPMRISGVKNSRQTIMLRLENIDEKTTADKLAGHFVFVDQHNLAPPPPGMFFVHDILGCRVFEAGKEIGRIVEVYTRSQGLAQDIWVVEHSGAFLWIPAVKAFLEEIDVVNRRITVRRTEELPS